VARDYAPDPVQAAVARNATLEVAELEDPRPGSGHVLVRTLACGICGSDLHAAQDLRRFTELTSRVGGPGGLDPDRDLVFGHEFCAEIVDFGPNTQRSLAVGTPVCSLPVIVGPTGPQPLGYSNNFPGGLAELMTLQELLLLPVPDGLAPEHAALTEPLAVGRHAVARADLTGGEVCLVVGAGPVGLAVIAALRERGVGPVIAADFSPTRRRLAELLGADEVVDPAVRSPHASWADLGLPTGVGDRAMMDTLGMPVRDCVIFEAVGAPGVLQGIVDGAPPRARVVVVGVCMQPDGIEPFVAVAKELDVRFAFGYSPAEFAATLEVLGRHEVPADALITMRVGLDGAADAFDALRDPAEHGKVLVHH
jgi:threonine dehydrogenase-like Zn-dependent dehydrogenase